MELFPTQIEQALPKFFDFALVFEPIVRRQFARLLSQKLDHVKIVVSLIEGATAESHADFERIVVVSDLLDEERLRCEGILRGHPPMEWLPLHFSGFLHCLETVNSTTLFVICGESRPYAEPSWFSVLHNALALYPDVQRTGAEQMAAYLRRPPVGHSLVSEEGRGRFRPMEFDAKFIKNWQKHLQSLGQETLGMDKKIELLTGWGYGAFAVKPALEKSASNIAFAIESMAVDPALSLHRFCEELDAFMLRSEQHQKAKGPIARETPAECSIITPVWSLSHFLGEHVSRHMDRSYDIPDAVVGWHPILSFVQKIAGAHQPAQKCIFMETFYRPLLISCMS